MSRADAPPGQEPYRDSGVADECWLWVVLVAIYGLEESMTDRTYRVTEIVGTSPESVEAAIKGALHRAAQTLRHLDWFEVTQIRGQIIDGEVAHYQVGLKVGFRLEDA